MRPSTDEYFLRMAKLAATRSTCFRRNVGCVLVDKDKRVIGTGYNGVPSGEPHCNDEVTWVHVPEKRTSVSHPHKCPGADSPSGTNLQACRAIHAEANALISCREPQDIWSAYCTASPCSSCVGMLLNTSCRNIYFLEEYPHADSMERWTAGGRNWTKVEL